MQSTVSCASHRQAVVCRLQSIFTHSHQWCPASPVLDHEREHVADANARVLVLVELGDSNEDLVA